MKQTERTHHLIMLLKTRRFESHEALLEALEQAGVDSTQATLSRDLNRLGVKKAHGLYQLPGSNPSLQIIPAGPNLLVLKTLPGRASAIAAEIDAANLDGLAGTVAGDDTIFIAIRDLKAQNHIQKQLLEKFGRGP